MSCPREVQLTSPSPPWRKQVLHICTFILIFLIYKMCLFFSIGYNICLIPWLGSRIKSLACIHFDIWQSWFYPCCENYFLTPIQPQKWCTPKLETQMGTAWDVRTQMRTDEKNREVENSSCSWWSCRALNTGLIRKSEFAITSYQNTWANLLANPIEIKGCFSFGNKSIN